MNHQTRRLFSKMSSITTYHQAALSTVMSHYSSAAPFAACNAPPPAFVPIGWRRSNRSLIQHQQQQRKKHQSIMTRLFGCNPNSPDAHPGDILLDDDRLNNNDNEDDANNNNNNNNPNILPINLLALRQTIEHTREIIGYPTYDISVSLITDSQMREINSISRGIDKPTDVLSFCFQEEDEMIEPGVLGDVQFDTPDFYNLGDVLIDVDYVQRRCEEDRKMHSMEAAESDKIGENGGGLVEGEVITDEQAFESTAADSTTTIQQEQQREDNEEANTDESSDDDDEEYEYIEIEVEEYDDRGVAPQMQYIYDPEIRIHMLLVHGMLHLVGYDHIEDDDYELMVVREDEVLAELRRRLGNNFGVSGKALPE
mmetsp:Transcript_31529/g.53792  ORF Transcript_31529/g.53792 Transcript_31529/m.53792 type:complete len:369 (+) Transcript_31529:109-1215(+)